MYLCQNLNNDEIKILPFTTAVVVTYIGEMVIQPHCNNRYLPDGEFLDNLNSQVAGTATVILIIGDKHRLKFDLHHQELQQEKVNPEVSEHFDFEHGRLFILHPSDEKPSFRDGLKKYGRTFYKHSCFGISGTEDGMSIGIVFRATSHLTEVQSETGQVVLDDFLQLNVIGINEDKEKTRKKKRMSSIRKRGCLRRGIKY